MKAISSITLFLLGALALGAAQAGSYQSGGYHSGKYHQGQSYHAGSQRPAVRVYVITGAQDRRHQRPYAVGVRPVQFTYDNGGSARSPGQPQHQRPDRRYEQRLPRGHEQRFQQPPHRQRNPAVQQGSPRAGENQFGSGNTQMPRPPQMNQPGPAQGQGHGQGYRPPQQRYSR